MTRFKTRLLLIPALLLMLSTSAANAQRFGGLTIGVGGGGFNNGFGPGFGYGGWNNGFGPGVGIGGFNNGFAPGFGYGGWNNGFGPGVGIGRGVTIGLGGVNNFGYNGYNGYYNRGYANQATYGSSYRPTYSTYSNGSYQPNYSYSNGSYQPTYSTYSNGSYQPTYSNASVQGTSSSFYQPSYSNGTSVSSSYASPCSGYSTSGYSSSNYSMSPTYGSYPSTSGTTSYPNDSGIIQTGAWSSDLNQGITTLSGTQSAQTSTRLKFTVPSDCEMWIDGKETERSGTTREFTSESLTSYGAVKIKMKKGDQTREFMLPVRPGEVSTTDLTSIIR